MSVRDFFGGVAFAVAAAVIWLVLSPHVPPEKEAISNVILGNVLGWPAIVMSWHFGSSSGSKEKTALLAKDDAFALTPDMQERVE